MNKFYNPTLYKAPEPAGNLPVVTTQYHLGVHLKRDYRRSSRECTLLYLCAYRLAPKKIHSRHLCCKRRTFRPRQAHPPAPSREGAASTPRSPRLRILAAHSAAHLARPSSCARRHSPPLRVLRGLQRGRDGPLSTCPHWAARNS